MVFAKQPCHFFTGLAFANAIVVLNPEARRFRDDLIVRRKSHAGTHLIGLVSTPNQNSAVHDGNDAEKWCIYRDQSAGSIRKCLELFQGDVEHRPSSIKQLGDFASDYLMARKGSRKWQSKCSYLNRRFYDLSRMQERK
jgi:hypothetical protein